MVLTAIVILIPTFFLVKTAIEYISPNQMRLFAFKIAWKAFELYSNVEIYTSRMYNKYVSTFITKPLKQPIIKFICDGEEIVTYTLNEFLKKKENDAQKIKVDFILYDMPLLEKNDNYDYYVYRYENINDVACIEYNSLKCFELNMMQITINNSKMPIAIDLGRKQYMLNGNVLFDREFLKWYLNMYCNTILNADDKYIITFIDNKMNYITLPDYCYIVIKKNGYDIVNNITL